MGDSNVNSLVCDVGGVSITNGSSGITMNGLTLTIVGQNSEAYNPGSIDDGDEAVGELTVTGAVLGDYALSSNSIDVADLNLTAQVTAADTVTYQLNNNTGGAIDLDEGTVKVAVIRIA